MPIPGIIASSAQVYPSFLTYLSNAGRYSASYVNSSGIYVAGGTTVSTTTAAAIARLNFDGTVNWQRTLNRTGGTDTINSIKGDSSGNIYVAGVYYVDATDTRGAFVAKYNSSGTIQWQKRFDYATTNESFASLAVDSSGNFYGAGTYDGSASPGTPSALITKFNDTPSNSWSRYFQPEYNINFTREFDSMAGVTLDSSGDVYVVTAGYNTILGTNEYYTSIKKYNSSGTYLRDIYYTSSGNLRTYAVSSGNNAGTYSDNIYLAGNANPNSSNAFLVKIDTSGTVSWSRSLNTSNFYTGVAVSNAGDIYAITHQTASSDRRIIVVKYNSSGTLQWQRRLDTNTGVNTQDADSITIDESAARVIVSGRVGGNLFVAFLPMDGSGTGTYNVGSYTIVYDTPTLTSSTVTRTGTVRTDGTGGTTVTPTISDSNLTDAASTYTVNNVQF